MKKNKKNAAHIRYKNKEGKRVPGVSTISGLRAKPQLLVWSNKLGLEGISMNQYTDDLANVGVLTHERVLAHFKGETADTNEYSQNDISRSDNAMKSFDAWTKSVKIEPTHNELQLVSDKFGGTIDMIADINGIKTLVDFKTSSAIYEDQFVQCGGYALLAEDAGIPIKQTMIVRIGRDSKEGFEARTVQDMTKYKDIFRHLLAIYYLEK